MQQGNYQIQKQQQVQTLSPQQVLAVKLLELPAVELEERVRAELLDNPALEEGRSEESGEMTDEMEENGEAEQGEEEYFLPGSHEDLSLGDYRTEDDIPDYKLRQPGTSPEAQAAEIPFSDVTSFYETLQEQADERSLSEHQRSLVEYLIGSLDDDGLLRKELSTIADELSIHYNIETDTAELEETLHVLQDFDPAGVGARSLQECLLLQLRRKEDSPSKQTAMKILTKCYEEFTHKHWEKILQRLSLSPEQFEEAKEELTRLNPRPGSSLGEAVGRSFQQIIPDFLVETLDDGTVTLSLNDRELPELRVSHTFREMLDEHTRNGANQSRASKDAMLFLKQKMDAAQGFIDAVRQRQETMYKTMQAIIDLQRPFFKEGDESLLRPLILKDVAERTGLDISTVSRVSNSKYVQTNYGIYPLKFFFGDGYVTEEGEELSVREIRRILKECVDNEEKSRPLTDEELAAVLKEKGFPIARRTVAKYREQLSIPVARLRK